MKNISSELEFGGKQSLETLENHEHGLLPFNGMGRPDLDAVNCIGSLAKSKERLLSQSSAHFSSNETLNSCEQPLLPASPNYLSSWPDKLDSSDWRQPIDRCDWRNLKAGRSLRKCQNPCMNEARNGAEARGMVRSASLLEIRNSPKFSPAEGVPNVDFGPKPCLGQCGIPTAEDKLSESNANDSNTQASKACCYCSTRRASSPATSHSESSNGPVSLSAVLENIPIAYNPRTKQLHIISVCPNQAQQPGCRNESDGLDTTHEHEDSVNEKAHKTTDSVCPRTDAGPEHPRTGTLQRVSTCGSSISSISSLSTEFSVSTASAFDEGVPIFDVDEAGFIEINLDRQSNRSERSLATHEEGPLSEDECAVTQGAKPKKRGFTGFLSRNLLPWKSSKEVTISDSTAAGWKLFGKAAPRHSNVTDPNKVIEEYHARQRNQTNPPTDGNTTPRSRKSEELIASSTTALILENRPSYLPAKNPEEEIKHRVQYEQMVEAAKKKELKEAKLKKKLLQQQLRHEEQLSHASKIWNSNILPCWDTMKNNRRTKDLWWQGIPPSVRGKVWKLAIGNDLHITPELYEICVCRAKDRIRMAAELISMSEDDFDESDSDKEGSVQLIKLDVSRTFPQLCIFQKGGPYYDMLHSLLGAYVCYRPDVGYVQGMSFLAAVLILNLDVADAFICFANLLNQPCQLAFFRLDEPMMRSYFLTYEEFFKENMPKLFNHFTRQNLSPDLYLIDWIYTVYSRSLPLDVASRVWDVFFRDGDEFLFRTALGILKLYEDILINLDFIHLAQFLTKLPEDIAAEPLFRSIECIRMVTDKHNFAHVLLSHADSKQT